ncbi:Protein NLRC5 [Dissostichus eleginoides]|uniref:Protein NLRC5 n=1 Tax=Dissostichus eleginoides TaxID=100907 RepID=A0AAD9C0I2_DISEL|nr:Protein NLRC5 [Dissostichus eleginoides]
MASTTQSALEHVSRARTHLVKTLKNLSVILENLNQQGVLRDEEVSKIQAEGNDYDKNRTLLDSVTKKGEAASYEFLKIIDITRKRTLGRTSLIPEKQTVASAESKTFDLHHWISCFPFKEDTQMGNNYLQAPTPCHRYQAKLKSKAQKISKEFWTANKDLFEENSKPDLSYMSLVLDTQGRVSPSKIKTFKSKKSKMSRSKKLGTYIPKDKADISPSDLLKTDKNILLVGKSGIGKTALTHEMLKLWTEKDDKELDYMFYFDMRKISNIKSLEDLLFNEFSEPDEGKDEVLQDIKNNSDNVTLMFDGITDLSSPVVQKLVNKDWLQDSKVVLTCRPADEDHLLSEDFLRVEEESLDPYPCCAVAYVITQSKERKIWLNLEDVTMSQQGMRPLLGCLQNVQWCDSLPRQLWEIFLLSEGEMDYITLLGLDGNQLHLPVEGERKLFERAVTVLQKIRKKVQICLHWEREKPDCHSLCETLLEALPNVSSLSFRRTHRGPGLQDQERCYETLKREEKQLFLDLCLRAANHIQGESSQNEVNNLISLFSFNTDVHNILLDFYQHVKTQESSAVIQKLKSVLQSAPAVWTIDLSQRKTSILLEVLRLQPEKKQVRLRGCSDEESEVRTLLQCLPYISQISFVPQLSEPSGELQFFGTLNPQCDFLLDLYSHLKDYETETGLSVLPSLQSVLQSAAAVWIIDLSERKTPILLEVLRLQPEKKQVKLIGCSDEESEVRTLLQCLPYISQLSFSQRFGLSEEVKIFGTLLCAAAEREQQTGEKTLELLSSVCTYPTFPLPHIDDEDDEEYQCGFLLDLASHLKDCETESGLSVLPSLQSVLQSAPAVWRINLSQRKSSILLEVLRLQPEKKQVKLIGCSDGESEVRTFLQCLPYISQLSCGPEFFQRVCTFISVRSREEAERLASLLQLSGFTLLLSGELPRKTCLSVGRVLQLCGSKVDLILKPRKMSVKGALALFIRTTQLHSLKLSNDMALLLCGWVRRWGVVCQVTVEELSLSPQTTQPSHRVLLKVVSSLASLLRYWAVRQLDLTEVCVPALGLTPLLLHDGPLKIKLSEKNVQQLLSLLHELQDQDLTWSFLSKVGGDLTSFSLNWELLRLLLQHPSAQTLTVNMRKNLFLQENITRLLPYLDRIVFKRPCPSFVLTAIREIYKARASPIIPSLLRSLDHVINLTCRDMSPMDCDALLYTLAHSDGVRLNLLWTSIPAWKIESILLNLDNVSQLSVDRNLLLRLVHGCAASDAQQGAAESLLRTVQHRLDLSCSSFVELPEEDQSDTLRLTAEDCRAVSTILRRSRGGTQLILQDCEVQDSGLDLLFPVLPKVKLRASKAVLLQLVSLVPVNSERDTVGRAVSLCKALEGELDLSHSSLDQRACAALALMLDFSEELTELDLSHCQLTDQLLLTLSAQLHKVQVLDLSHNNITDASTDLLLQLVSINPSIHTVRLFGNNIVYRTFLEKDKKFEIW